MKQKPLSRISLIFIITHAHYIFYYVISKILRKEYRWILIVGLGHTGSTVLNYRLNFFKKVYACPIETAMFAGSNLRRKLYVILLEGAAFKYDAELIVEKTPIHREFITEARQFLKTVEFIVTVRPLEQVVSSQKERYDVHVDELIYKLHQSSEQLRLKLKTLPNNSWKCCNLQNLPRFIVEFTETNSLIECSKMKDFKRNNFEKILERIGISYERTQHEKLRFNQVFGKTDFKSRTLPANGLSKLSKKILAEDKEHWREYF